MQAPKPLAITRLKKRCTKKTFPRDNTQVIEPLDRFIGQQRAEQAVRFAIAVVNKGYNLFAVGENGLGKRTMLKRFLSQHAEQLPAPSDWCYVNNYESPRHPWALKLPCGMASELKKDMEALIREVRHAIPSAFDQESFIEKAELIRDDFSEEQEQMLRAIAEKAGEHHLKLILQNPGGYSFVPVDTEGEPIPVKEFNALSEEQREPFKVGIELMEKELRAALRDLAYLEKNSREKQQALNEKITLTAIQHWLDELRDKYASQERVVAYLNAVQKDLVENVEIFLEEDENTDAVTRASLDHKVPARYQVNIMVSHDPEGGAPLVIEDMPTHNNLVGHVENVTYMGTVATDFSLIRPGCLHRANGGFLVLDAGKLLQQPYAWDGLKLALRTGCLRIDTLEKQLTLSGSVSLEPEPIALEVTVALLGDAEQYYLLQQYDPDFNELFKVLAEFESDMPRTDENQWLYARLISSMVQQDGLLDLSRDAIMRVIEQGARNAGHQDRLSLNAADLNHLLRESDYWARSLGKTLIDIEALDQAISSRQYRSGHIKERMFDSIKEGVILIDTQGEKVGQVNGLTVLHIGDSEFGQPSRITATVHYGTGEVLDIERSVQLGGALHSKGIMILTSFLNALFGHSEVMPLAASLVFEQSYHGVDGDSASLGELVCLLSAMSGCPVKQSIAVTGSINQFGEVQPIGGVNEKIEGFFDTCQSRGLTGDQAAIIPIQNINNLMLKDEVIEACKQGQFAIYAVEHVDQAIKLMTGVNAGQANEKGYFAINTLYGKIQLRLEALRKKAQGQKNKVRKK
ncbi:lon-related putative ATP-dependent protease [Oceanospirillum multiglobuliferum]|uniref:endopeptidase La n=1 Tax=Oceanospirillum multiglobuliferum TaxID=64969 RepID=A0A1T4KH28_9GAMM|nr:ATP-binding protein [Oceanospirillum multiglobuliferum]OPX56034.1 ATP-dependent protease [Oceanospirillum multiglobuliferum]SJZ41676.1 lon-related putative ATP-dependent protease [Oceanospirillum multiglobuliferum]